MMAVSSLGPGAGTVEIHTYREGVAQKVGHDLIIDVGSWSANVDVDEAGSLQEVAFEVDTTSLHVREGRNGLKPLTDKDRGQIRETIDAKILRGEPIVFRSTAVAGGSITGELTIRGTTRTETFTIAVHDGRVSGTLTVNQSVYGISPYKALMGALKVRDDVEVVLDVALPS